jgi:hypothetical protein
VTLRDGSMRRWEAGALYGSPENPMSEAALVAKFMDCGRAARRPVAATVLQDISRRLLALEQVTDMRELLREL